MEDKLKFLFENPKRFDWCREWFDLSQGQDHPIIGCLQDLHKFAVGSAQHYKSMQPESYWAVCNTLVTLECAELVSHPLHKSLLRDLAKMYSLPGGKPDLTKSLFLEVSNEKLGTALPTDPDNHFDEGMDAALLKQYARIVASHVKKSNLPHVSALLRHVKSMLETESPLKGKGDSGTQEPGPELAQKEGPTAEGSLEYKIGDFVKTQSRTHTSPSMTVAKLR